MDDSGQEFSKFFVFDEAHKYMAKGRVSQEIVEMIREMRHRRMTVLIASQDPEGVEFEVHKLSTITVVHKTRSEKSLNVLRQGNLAWEGVTHRAARGAGAGRGVPHDLVGVGEGLRAVGAAGAGAADVRDAWGDDPHGHRRQRLRG